MIRMFRLSGHSFAVNRLRCPPITAAAQCGFGMEAHAKTKKLVRHGGH